MKNIIFKKYPVCLMFFMLIGQSVIADNVQAKSGKQEKKEPQSKKSVTTTQLLLGAGVVAATAAIGLGVAYCCNQQSADPGPPLPCQVFPDVETFPGLIIIRTENNSLLPPYLISVAKKSALNFDALYDSKKGQRKIPLDLWMSHDALYKVSSTEEKQKTMQLQSTNQEVLGQYNLRIDINDSRDEGARDEFLKKLSKYEGYTPSLILLYYPLYAAAREKRTEALQHISRNFPETLCNQLKIGQILRWIPSDGKIRYRYRLNQDLNQDLLFEGYPLNEYDSLHDYIKLSDNKIHISCFNREYEKHCAIWGQILKQDESTTVIDAQIRYVIKAESKQLLQDFSPRPDNVGQLLLNFAKNPLLDPQQILTQADSECKALAPFLVAMQNELKDCQPKRSSKR